MKNIIDDVFEFISNSKVIGDDDRNFAITPAGKIYAKDLYQVKFHNLLFDVHKKYNNARPSSRWQFSFFFYDRNKIPIVTDQDATIVATIDSVFKHIYTRGKINYNNEDIKSIKFFSDGRLQVTTYEGVETTTTLDGVKTTVKPDGTKHILQPSGLLTVITGQDVITVLSETASVATIAMLILMIADMRSGKGKKGQVSTPNAKVSEKLDEIKEISVLMSDGTRPSFKSWQHDPDEVKKFVEMFQSTPTAQKPLRVTFTLKSGSKIVIKVDENSADQQKLLDEFIEHLKN